MTVTAEGVITVWGQTHSMAMDTNTFLAQQRDDVLRELVAISTDAARARKLIEVLKQNLSTVAYLEEQAQGKYRGYKKAREALMALFEAEARPLSEDQIKQEVVNMGGFRRGTGGVDGARLVIQKSIKLHLYGSGAKKWPLKKLNGLIGPKAWPDELFGVEQSADEAQSA